MIAYYSERTNDATVNIFFRGGKTDRGGMWMENKEIQIGNVTYQLSRAFVGSKTPAELLIDTVIDRAREEVAVDAREIPAV